MHILHHIAVEATSSKSAFQLVKDFAEDVDWSDWCVVGGGRWSSKPGSEDTPQDVISYVKNKQRFTKAFELSRESRKSQMKYYLDGICGENEAMFMIEVLKYMKTGDAPHSIRAYYFNQASSLLCGRYISDSFFYDLQENVTSFDYLLDRLINNPEKQYLVPVDFHS
jgi:hypothetical protein